MNDSTALAHAPRDGLVAEFREVILNLRPRADAELIERACNVAARCHQGQLRYSGDPYITHPVAVATILAGLGDVDEVDDQTLCAAVLHDTVEDTPYTMPALRREFGAGTAAMVAEVTALDRLGRRPGRNPIQVMATIRSADTRVVAVKLADRLHNMQTLQFLPQAKQLRKAREVLDTFLPVAEQLNLRTVRSELQALAFAALIRNQPLRPPRRRVILALDIENSTSRPDPVKAELRTMLYELFGAALRSAGVGARRRGRFTDRGDGLLALIDPADQALLFNVVIPDFGQLLASYNTSLPQPGGRDRQLRVRVVMHTGNVHDDDNGYFGEALDIAFRLLDAPRRKGGAQGGTGPPHVRCLQRRRRLSRTSQPRWERPPSLPPPHYRRGSRPRAPRLDPHLDGSHLAAYTRRGESGRNDQDQCGEDTEPEARRNELLRRPQKCIHL